MVTGNMLTALGGENTIAEKRITLFKELVPSLSRLGMLGASWPPGVRGIFESEEAAGRSVSSRLGFETRVYSVKTADEFESAITSAVREGIDALYLSGETLLINNLSRLVPLVMSTGKPAVGPYVEFARAGVLMSYSADVIDGYRRAGIYAAKVLQGTKPGDLPIEQPTKFTLAINAKSAAQLGISIPPTLLAQADEVIE
jgi:putative ABC transport system substrate-binding protein